MPCGYSSSTTPAVQNAENRCNSHPSSRLSTFSFCVCVYHRCTFINIDLVGRDWKGKITMKIEGIGVSSQRCTHRDRESNVGDERVNGYLRLIFSGAVRVSRVNGRSIRYVVEDKTMLLVLILCIVNNWQIHFKIFDFSLWQAIFASSHRTPFEDRPRPTTRSSVQLYTRRIAKPRCLFSACCWSKSKANKKKIEIRNTSHSLSIPPPNRTT